MSTPAPIRLLAEQPDRDAGDAPAGRRRSWPTPRLPLKVKLSLLITSLLALTVLVVSTFLLRQQQQRLTAEMTKRGLTIAQNLAASAKTAILTEDDLTLNLLIKEVMQDDDVAYVAITDHRGRTVAHSDVSQVGRRLERPPGLAAVGDEPLVQRSTSADGEPLLDFALPLTFRDVPVGAVYLGFSQASTAAALAAARHNVIAISAVMIAAGIGGAVALSVFLSRPIRRLMESTRLVAGGDFTVALSVPSRDEIGALTEAFNAMVRSLREKEAIKAAFTRYVAPEVVNEILKDPESLVLRGEHRDVTVLFCDIRGFTPIAERLAPDDVVAVLNRFYELIVDTTLKHEGSLNKFLGDGVMAVFGAPVFRPDHPVLAVRAALAMQAAIQDLSGRWTVRGRPRIAVGIGVNAGPAVAGTVGTEERMEYTVIGDSVNLAARLQAMADAGQILITEETYWRVSDAVEARSLGHIKVRGKRGRIGIYEVTGSREP